MAVRPLSLRWPSSCGSLSACFLWHVEAAKKVCCCSFCSLSFSRSFYHPLFFVSFVRSKFLRSDALFRVVLGAHVRNLRHHDGVRIYCREADWSIFECSSCLLQTCMLLHFCCCSVVCYSSSKLPCFSLWRIAQEDKPLYVIDPEWTPKRKMLFPALSTLAGLLGTLSFIVGFLLFSMTCHHVMISQVGCWASEVECLLFPFW